MLRCRCTHMHTHMHRHTQCTQTHTHAHTPSPSLSEGPAGQRSAASPRLRRGGRETPRAKGFLLFPAFRAPDLPGSTASFSFSQQWRPLSPVPPSEPPAAPGPLSRTQVVRVLTWIIQETDPGPGWWLGTLITLISLCLGGNMFIGSGVQRLTTWGVISSCTARK